MLKKLKQFIAFLLIFQSLGGIFFNYSSDASSGVATEEICMDDQTPLAVENNSVLHQIRFSADDAVGSIIESSIHFHFQSYLESLDRPPKASFQS